MPRKKTSASVAKSQAPSRATTKKDDDALMEFEQFISQKPSRGGSARVWLAFTLVVMIIILAAAWIFVAKFTNLEKENKFKAIYLENGQVYYAKVVKEDSLNVYLDDVYYIQIEQQAIPANDPEDPEAEPQIIEVPVLVKRGEEIHRPQGLMQVNRSKVVAIEEIGADSQILTEINKVQN